jgi:hypothetical protein
MQLDAWVRTDPPGIYVRPTAGQLCGSHERYGRGCGLRPLSTPLWLGAAGYSFSVASSIRMTSDCRTAARTIITRIANAAYRLSGRQGQVAGARRKQAGRADQPALISEESRHAAHPRQGCRLILFAISCCYPLRDSGSVCGVS